MLRIGAHVGQEDPIAEAVARGADLVQFFLGDPQGWDEPALRYPGGPVALREAAAAHGIDLYVHAPYVINVATTNNRVRFPSRKLFQQTLDKAAEIGVKGVIVHGGHVLRADDPAQGVANWRKTLERTHLPVPVLLENTAGGDHAMTRRLDAIARLWEECGQFELGFCLDTCHAHAGGEDLLTVVDRVKAVTGRIDLVHANDSKDEFDSGRDRHENLGRGQIDPQALVGVVQAASAPVVVETPGAREGQGADIAWLRERLPA